MNVIELEQSIVDRLQPLTDVGVEVVGVPETQAAFDRAVAARVTVMYSGLKLMMPSRESASIGVATQDFGVVIGVTIQARTLRSGTGIYALDEAVRGLLVGYRPERAGKMLLDGVEFTQFEQNVWTYSLTFIAPVRIVEKPDEEALVNLTRLQIKDDSGDVVVEVP